MSISAICWKERAFQRRGAIFSNHGEDRGDYQDRKGHADLFGDRQVGMLGLNVDSVQQGQAALPR
jgi:hypothetical protein